MLDLTTQLANMAISFDALADRHAHEAVDRTERRNLDMAIGFPIEHYPDPSAARAMSQFFRRHADACRRGLVLADQTCPNSTPVTAWVPQYWEVWQQAVSEQRVLYPERETVKTT